MQTGPDPPASRSRPVRRDRQGATRQGSKAKAKRQAASGRSRDRQGQGRAARRRRSPGRGAKPAKAKAKPAGRQEARARRSPSPTSWSSARTRTTTPSGYHLRLQLDQSGRGGRVEVDLGPVRGRVRRPTAAPDQGRSAPAQADRRTTPVRRLPRSLAMTLASDRQGRRRPTTADAEDADRPRPPRPRSRSTAMLWEVVRDKDDAPAVRPITKTDRRRPRRRSRARRSSSGPRSTTRRSTVTKTYRLWKGEDGFEVELKFDSPDEDAKLAYRLFGPHGIPIEGEWYTGTFRDVFFGQVKGGTTKIVDPVAATTSSRTKANPDRFHDAPAEVRRGREPVFRHLRRALTRSPGPPRTAGISEGDRRSSSTRTPRHRRSRTSASRSSPSRSRSARTSPVAHTYRVFAGPKTGRRR